MKNTCTFFGHKDCPVSIKQKIYDTVRKLIIEKNVTIFYVGNQGQFDFMVRGVLKQLKTEYPQIEYSVVLAYIPGKKYEYEDYSDTMIPEGLEQVHPRYAIAWRNNWMLMKSNYTVVYVTRTWGGAYQFAESAKKKSKNVINIAHT